MPSDRHLRYGRYCCVPWCPHSGQVYPRQVPDPGLHLFRIPRDNRSAAWVAYTGRDDLKTKPAVQLYSSHRMCSNHFAAQDFMDPGRTRLTRTAVPTVRRVERGGLEGAPSTRSSPASEQDPCSLDDVSDSSPETERPVVNVPCSAPAGRSLLKKPLVTVKPPQTEVASNQETITRPQKTKLAPFVSQGLAAILPHVSEEPSSTNGASLATDGPVEDVVSQPKTPHERVACSVLEAFSNSMAEHQSIAVSVKQESPSTSPTFHESSSNSSSSLDTEETTVYWVPAVWYTFHKGTEQVLLETIDEQRNTIDSLKTYLKVTRDHAAKLKAELSQSQHSLAETQRLCERLRRENIRLAQELSAARKQGKDVEQRSPRRQTV